MADWTGDCYYTLSPQYVSNQLQIFYQLYEKVNSNFNMKVYYFLRYFIK